MSEFPTWAIICIGAITGSICAFLGMAGNALQEYARRQKRNTKEHVDG